MNCDASDTIDECELIAAQLSRGTNGHHMIS